LFSLEWEWPPHGGEAKTRKQREEKILVEKIEKRKRTFWGVVMYVVVIMKKGTNPKRS